jgi:hypothetical protein
MPNRKSEARTVQDIAERFWARVKKAPLDSKECWVWTGKPLKSGYGQVQSRGISKMPLLTHRIAWELTYGPIPEGKHVLHHCDNPPCCRPDHLFLGDQISNTADRHAKGRTASGDRNGARTKREANPFVKNRGSGLKGEFHPMADLSDVQVVELCAEYAADPIRGKKAALARKYNISQTHVGRLITSKIRSQPVPKQKKAGI